jgi:thiol-disulfide isomerase/thioredoxin
MLADGRTLVAARIFFSAGKVFAVATMAALLMLLPLMLSAAMPGVVSTEEANTIFSAAKTDAAAQHKNVLLVFSASWCPPCHLYEGFLEDPAMKPLMEKAFVIRTLDVGEKPTDKKHANTPGAEELRGTLTVPTPGFPYIAMLKPDGTLITDSMRPVRKAKLDIGYPYAPEEIDWYMKMMKKAAPALSAEELKQMDKWLRKHGQ